MTELINHSVLLDIYRVHQREREEEARQYRLAHLKSHIIKRFPKPKIRWTLWRKDE